MDWWWKEKENEEEGAFMSFQTNSRPRYPRDRQGGLWWLKHAAGL